MRYLGIVLLCLVAGCGGGGDSNSGGTSVDGIIVGEAFSPDGVWEALIINGKTYPSLLRIEKVNNTDVHDVFYGSWEINGPVFEHGVTGTQRCVVIDSPKTGSSIPETIRVVDTNTFTPKTIFTLNSPGNYLASVEDYSSSGIIRFEVGACSTGVCQEPNPGFTIHDDGTGLTQVSGSPVTL